MLGAARSVWRSAEQGVFRVFDQIRVAIDFAPGQIAHFAIGSAVLIGKPAIERTLNMHLIGAKFGEWRCQPEMEGATSERSNVGALDLALDQTAHVNRIPDDPRTHFHCAPASRVTSDCRWMAIDNGSLN